jgi:protein gp37
MPRRIGVDFSADFWDEGFTMSDRKSVFAYVIEAYWHWFINLTKQPQNIPETFAFPKNWAQGITVNRKEDLPRIDLLKKTQAKLKFISFEPLYEDLDIVDLSGIDWVIIGAQTHPSLFPEFSWVANLIYSARLRKIPIFIKNNLPAFDVKQYPAKLLFNSETEK